MNKIVLDSSAMLAVLNREPGGERLTAELMSVATCSTVNLAEVHGRLVSGGLSEKEAWAAAREVVDTTEAFTTEQAHIAGGLINQTRSLGLSLGDRACLALGLHLKAPVYSADRAWKKLNLPIEVHVIR